MSDVLGPRTAAVMGGRGQACPAPLDVRLAARSLQPSRRDQGSPVRGLSLDDPDRLRAYVREGGLTGARVEQEDVSGDGGAALLEADPARAPNDRGHRLIKPSTGHEDTAGSVDQVLSLRLPDLEITLPSKPGSQLIVTGTLSDAPSGPNWAGDPI